MRQVDAECARIHLIMKRNSNDSPPIAKDAWKRLAACTVAAALLQIDGTLITVALPSVQSALDVGSGTVALVLTVYFVAYAAALFPGGRLTDKIGSRSVALAGLALFALGALVGALAQDFTVLVISRVIQGAGAGLVSPATLAGAISGFPPERRGSALGIWGAASGAANLLGPLLGGILVVVGGWRACWWALIPLSAIAVYMVWRSVPRTVHNDETPDVFDLRKRVVAAAAAVAALTFTVMIGTFFLAQQYLQEVAGYSALGAGVILMVVALMVGVATPIAGLLSDRVGERLPAMAGFILTATGMLILGIPGVPLSGFEALPMLVPIGLGLGLLFAPASRAALNAVPQAKHGRVSSVLSAARLTGAAIGSILAGTAVASGVTTGNVRVALLSAAAICILLGLPAAAQLGSRRAVRTTR